MLNRLGHMGRKIDSASARDFLVRLQYIVELLVSLLGLRKLLSPLREMTLDILLSIQQELLLVFPKRSKTTFELVRPPLRRFKGIRLRSGLSNLAGLRFTRLVFRMVRGVNVARIWLLSSLNLRRGFLRF